MARSFASKATGKRTKASTTRQPDRILKNKSSSKAKQAVQLRARKDARGHAKKKDMEGGKSVRPEAEGDHRSAGKMRRSGGKSKATRGYDAESNGTKSKSIAAHSRQSNSKRKVDYSYGDQTDEGTSHSSDDQTDEEDQIAPLATKTLSTRPRDEVDDGGYSSSSSDGSLGSMDTGSCSSDDVGNRMSAGSEDSQDKTLVDDEVGSYDDDEGPRSITEENLTSMLKQPLHQAGRDIQREADSQIAVVLDSFAKMFSSFQESGRDMSSLMEQMVRLVQTEQTALEKHWDVFDEQNKRRLEELLHLQNNLVVTYAHKDSVVNKGRGAVTALMFKQQEQRQGFVDKVKTAKEEVEVKFEHDATKGTSRKGKSVKKGRKVGGGGGGGGGR